MQKWSSFEHLIWKNLTAYNIHEAKSYLLAVSGGVDSMVLLHALTRVRPMAQFKVVHVHHGLSRDEKINRFRNDCLSLIRSEVSKFDQFNVQLHTTMADAELSSEEQYRNFRWSYIREMTSEDDIVVTGHHLDDWLETILLKLIRGTSYEGLEAFKMWNDKVFRPFLNLNKQQLLNYATEQTLTWIEDPTNSDSEYLRNWLRHKWLPELEQRVTGGRDNLGKSLMRVLQNSTDNQNFVLLLNENINGNSLNRQWWQSLSQKDQIRALAGFLKSQNIFNFTSGQLEEIGKRLDKNQKDITFEILHRNWVIDASQVMLQLPESTKKGF